MESLERLVLFAFTVACAGLLLEASSTMIAAAAPTVDVGAIHDAIAAVAFRPGSTLTATVRVPPAASLKLEGSKLSLTGARIPKGLLKSLNESTWIVAEVGEAEAAYRLTFNKVELPGGFCYSLRFKAAAPGRVNVEVLGYAKL